MNELLRSASYNCVSYNSANIIICFLTIYFCLFNKKRINNFTLVGVFTTILDQKILGFPIFI